VTEGLDRGGADYAAVDRPDPRTGATVRLPALLEEWTHPRLEGLDVLNGGSKTLHGDRRQEA
jgi:hypothetical protein